VIEDEIGGVAGTDSSRQRRARSGSAEKKSRHPYPAFAGGSVAFRLVPEVPFPLPIRKAIV
jgi:hypothetical protein